MLIFELIKPGVNIVSDDIEWSRKVEYLLYILETNFYEANAALNMFIKLQEQIELEDSKFKEQFDRDMQRRRFIESVVRSEMNLPPHGYNENVYLEVEMRLKREKWDQGLTPRSHNHVLNFMYAKSFLYALDSIDKLTMVLSNEPNVPLEIKAIHDRIGQEFPNLRGVRNSTQHIEDRSRGLGAGKPPQPLKLKPIDNEFIKAKDGLLIPGVLLGNKFGATMANGEFGEVEVSKVSLSKIQRIIQDVFNSFSWIGDKRYLPT
ncbi:hypothetical protein [Citrobacter freundii]|uniref:hypothetical protein n=1 Tax=Citrobacter freundii TaxID=546 RepID=UPI0015EA1295|nr:hypothetical protein [Citrobacter freundii]QMN58310.1 hypothetical protein HVW68_09730 [Citrobacter freundii]CAE7282048.1 hypothetical protein AI2609V1_1920 [Citrobacter freundii]CAH3564703.1 hypothetical protein AI2609V1_1920 [Citrobacter freundii]